MKKIIFLTAMLLPAIAITTTVHAQNKLALDNEKIIKAYEHGTKVLVSTRALRNFIKEFPSAIADTWIKTSTGFMVTFTLNGIQNRAFLTTRGNLESRIQYYTEAELPPDVRHIVKTNYYDYSITTVKEVSTEEGTAYLVTIEFKNNWKVIRVVDREMDVWEEHQKS